MLLFSDGLNKLLNESIIPHPPPFCNFILSHLFLSVLIFDVGADVEEGGGAGTAPHPPPVSLFFKAKYFFLYFKYFSKLVM